MASDENQYLRRRLEAIERTTLKLNLGGASGEIQVLKDRLELESAEVLRLRETMYALQAEKLSMTEVMCKFFVYTLRTVQKPTRTNTWHTPRSLQRSLS